VRILVYPHSMEMGGSQLNAVQLAGAVRDRGHEVIVMSEPGPLVERVRDLGLEHLELPPYRHRPSLKVAGTLVRLVRERRVDVVHGYEWPPVIDAFLGPGLQLRTPLVGTVMSMSVAPFFPRTVPLLVGTEQIREAALAAGHRRVALLEPPVDTEADNPSVDGRSFRAQHGIQPDEVLMAMICRLVPELKLEGLLAACDAIGALARSGSNVRLVIVGDGRARNEVAERADRANASADLRSSPRICRGRCGDRTRWLGAARDGFWEATDRDRRGRFQRAAHQRQRTDLPAPGLVRRGARFLWNRGTRAAHGLGAPRRLAGVATRTRCLRTPARGEPI
jgi:glycosyltransferase involved in cell wall biosynthesis